MDNSTSSQLIDICIIATKRLSGEQIWRQNKHTQREHLKASRTITNRNNKVPSIVETEWGKEPATEVQ